MADIYDVNKRSEIMSKISAQETKPEIIVRKFLFSKGFRYLKNSKNIPGKPDIVLPKYKTVIFVHGCFWHGHNHCKASKLPETRKEFWEAKILGNIARDKKKTKELTKLGWKVLIIWQCEIGNKIKRDKTFKKLLKQLQN
jgi:DNA mismatch endonuclease (patch repair protein)